MNLWSPFAFLRILPSDPAYLIASIDEGSHFDQEIYEEPFIIYGLSVDETMQRIKKINPDVIGISILFSNNLIF